MDFFSASEPSPLFGNISLRAARAAARLDPAQCGWYDSSFELRDGLEVIEQADDELFQLWQLAAPGLKG